MENLAKRLKIQNISIYSKCSFCFKSPKKLFSAQRKATLLTVLKGHVIGVYMDESIDVYMWLRITFRQHVHSVVSTDAFRPGVFLCGIYMIS